MSQTFYQMLDELCRYIYYIHDSLSILKLETKKQVDDNVTILPDACLSFIITLVIALALSDSEVWTIQAPCSSSSSWSPTASETTHGKKATL